MSEPMVRVTAYTATFDTAQMSYWKDGEVWMIYLPGCGVGNLRNHTVTEHEDGTISVSPSILLTGHEDGHSAQRHGYIERGSWREV